MIQKHDQVTPRETMLHEWQKEEFVMQSEHATKMKQLEIEHLKLESKISAWYKLPITIIKLPLHLLLGAGYIVHTIRKTEPSDKFWEYLK